MQDYRKQSFYAPEDATREDLEDILAELIEGNAVSVQIINDLLNRQKEVKDKIKKASSIEPTVTDPIVMRELTENLQQQYPVMKAALEAAGIETRNIPSPDCLRQNLTIEKVNAASGLFEPSLLIMPPLSNKAMVRKIKKNIKCETPCSGSWSSENWNSNIRKWQIGIGEGIKNVPHDTKFSGENQNKYWKWGKALKEKGLVVMCDSNVWLAQMLKSLYEGEAIDTETFTAISHLGHNYHLGGAWMATADWAGDRIRFKRESAYEVQRNLRVRGLVWVYNDPELQTAKVEACLKYIKKQFSF